MKNTLLAVVLIVAACTHQPQTEVRRALSSDADFFVPTPTEYTGECERSEAPGYPDPEGLARDYVERDGFGEFTRFSWWLHEAHYCPGHLPGWDEIVLLRSARVDSVVVSGPIATAFVTYHQIGRPSEDAAGNRTFQEMQADVVKSLQMVHLQDGWRMRSQQHPHVLALPALALFRWPDSLRGAIQRLARQ